MKRTVTADSITIEQFSKIVQFMFEKRGYTTLQNDDKIITLEASDTSKLGGHLLHFPLDNCFCNGITYAIVPLKNAKVKTLSIKRETNKVLKIAFN